MKMCVPGLRGKLYRLGVPAVALLLWLPLWAAAQNPPADQKTQNPPATAPQASPNPQKPEEKKTPQPPPAQLQLETPEIVQPPAQKPEAKPQQSQIGRA